VYRSRLRMMMRTDSLKNSCDSSTVTLLMANSVTYESLDQTVNTQIFKHVHILTPRTYPQSHILVRFMHQTQISCQAREISKEMKRQEVCPAASIAFRIEFLQPPQSSLSDCRRAELETMLLQWLDLLLPNPSRFLCINT
jgi:hypothetical protein